MLILESDRPTSREVDFRVARLVVRTARGLDVDGRHLERGDEVPRGGLSDEALRQIYEPPLRQIETIEYVFMHDEALRTECLARGVHLGAAPPVQEEAHARQSYVIAPDLDRLSYGDLVELCKENGLKHAGNANALRSRLKASLGN